MRTHLLAALSPILVSGVVVGLACSSEKDRPPTLGGGSGNPTGMGGTGGGVGTDAAVTGDAFSDAFGDGGAVTASGVVRQPGDLLSEAANATAAPNITVRASKVGGGVTEVKSQLGGDFTLPDIAAAVAAPTWLQLVETGRTTPSSIVGVMLPGTLVLPLYRDTIVASSAGSIGLAVDTATRATVVIHVYNPQGARYAGIKARTVGTDRAYYDEGLAISATATQTGTSGTLVFYNVSPATSNPFSLTLERGATAYKTESLPIAAGAVTSLRISLQ